ENRGEIVGKGVVVVPGARMTRPSMTAAVVRDAAQTLFRERHHLVIPHVGGKRPRRQEHDRRTGSPVLEEQVLTVTGFNERAARRHGCVSRSCRFGLRRVRGQRRSRNANRGLEHVSPVHGASSASRIRRRFFSRLVLTRHQRERTSRSAWVAVPPCIGPCYAPPGRASRLHPM